MTATAMAKMGIMVTNWSAHCDNNGIWKCLKKLAVAVTV